MVLAISRSLSQIAQINYKLENAVGTQVQNAMKDLYVKSRQSALVNADFVFRILIQRTQNQANLKLSQNLHNLNLLILVKPAKDSTKKLESHSLDVLLA